MDFTLTDEQEMLVDTARVAAREGVPAELVRAVVDDPDVGRPRSGTSTCASGSELGAGPLVDLCLFLTEPAPRSAPGPFLATAALFVPLVQAIGRRPADGVAAPWRWPVGTAGWGAQR